MRVRIRTPLSALGVALAMLLSGGCGSERIGAAEEGAATTSATAEEGASATGASGGGNPTSATAAAAATTSATAASADDSDGSGGAAEGAEPVDEVRLGLTEWSIETGGAVLRPGQITVRVTNSGGTRHDVVIHGHEGTWPTPVLSPGDTHDMVITAVAGEELHLVCTLTGHESQGMHTSLRVTDS